MASFGIDFGTTNSVAAVVTTADRAATPLMSAQGTPYPSVVWYSPDGAKVGHVAKSNINAYAEMPGHRFIRSIKLQLGSGRAIDIAGRRLEVHAVAAEILRHLKWEAKASEGGYALQEAVVTIPVGFDGYARRDLRRAAEAAGIHVLTFVHEPFAAVVGHFQARGHSLATLPDLSLIHI